MKYYVVTNVLQECSYPWVWELWSTEERAIQRSERLSSRYNEPKSFKVVDIELDRIARDDGMVLA